MLEVHNQVFVISFSTFVLNIFNFLNKQLKRIFFLVDVNYSYFLYYKDKKTNSTYVRSTPIETINISKLLLRDH